MDNEIDIPLTKEEEKEKIEFLKKRKFSDFKIHPYYTEQKLHPLGCSWNTCNICSVS